MGFSQAARTYITDVQNMQTLEEFALLEDADVLSLCKVIHCPGGMVPNPNAAVGGQIANPGIEVSLIAEKNLKLMCYFLRYKQRTSYELVHAEVTEDSVRAMTGHKKWEENHKDVKAPEINVKDWPKTIEAIKEWLCGCLGETTKLPLSYTIRDEEEVDVAPAAGYHTKQHELILRAPIDGADGEHTADYLADRGRVWDLLSELCTDHECFSYIRPAQKTRDGRMAFQRLKEHYLGTNNVDTMSSAAEKKLASTVYRGEMRRWNFERYVKVHVNQHAILEGLEDYGYAGIDPRSKVRHLIEGIKTPRLDAVKANIAANTDLRNDFDACVNLFKEWISTMPAGNEARDVTIASVKSQGKKKKSSEHDDPDMTIQDRYYNKTEYRKLSQAQKLGLKLIRERNRGTGSGKSKKSNKGKISVNLSKHEIKALITGAAASKIEWNNDVEEDDDVDSEDSEVDMKPPAKKQKTSNRTNKALMRKV